MPTSELIIDTQTQGTNYLLEVTVGSTPTVKVYIDESASTNVVQSDDVLIVKKNPITG